MLNKNHWLATQLVALVEILFPAVYSINQSFLLQDPRKKSLYFNLNIPSTRQRRETRSKKVVRRSKTGKYKDIPIFSLIKIFKNGKLHEFGIS